jgi:hypothetical protein
VKFGIATFVTDDGVGPRRLGAAVEERGFSSLVVTEHSHIPVAHKEPYPGAGELPAFTALWTHSWRCPRRRRSRVTLS